MEYMIYTEAFEEAFEKSIKNVGRLAGYEHKKWEKIKDQNYTLYKYCSGRKDKKNAAESIAHIISDFVQQEVIESFAEEELKKYTSLNEQEKEEVTKMFLLSSCLKKEEGVSYIAYYLLYMPLLKALETEATLHIDGWIRFRTGQYKIILQDLLEQVVYDFEIQKEYVAFIQLLRESRALQKPLEKELHLVILQNGKMIILNCEKQEVTKEYTKKYCKDLVEERLTQQDLILNILIAISPERLVIHNPCHHAMIFLKTLRSLFQNQIICCSGCSCCEMQNISNKTKPIDT